MKFNVSAEGAIWYERNDDGSYRRLAAGETPDMAKGFVIVPEPVEIDPNAPVDWSGWQEIGWIEE